MFNDYLLAKCMRAEVAPGAATVKRKGGLISKILRSH